MKAIFLSSGHTVNKLRSTRRQCTEITTLTVVLEMKSVGICRRKRTKKIIYSPRSCLLGLERESERDTFYGRGDGGEGWCLPDALDLSGRVYCVRVYTPI